MLGARVNMEAKSKRKPSTWYSAGTHTHTCVYMCVCVCMNLGACKKMCASYFSACTSSFDSKSELTIFKTQ